MKYFWFGHNDILVKKPDDKEWEILTESVTDPLLNIEDISEEEEWIPMCETENGPFWFDKFSELIGLSADQEIQTITTELLDQMLQVAKTEASIFFMPPNQMSHIESSLHNMKQPPVAVLPEVCLFDPSVKEEVPEHEISLNQDYYISDWQQPHHVILRTIGKQAQSPCNYVPAPILMSASAFADHRPEILGHYTANKHIEFYTTTLTLPTKIKQGRRKAGLGLIWAWGWGKRLWQWALPYESLYISDHQRTFKLSQKKQSTTTLILSVEEEGRDIIVQNFYLKPPVLDWYLNPPPETPHSE